MDTMKDTTMQHVTDAVIDTLRKMQPTAWVYEDMLGRKCVGFERPSHRRNSHEPLFSAATHAVIMGLLNRLEAAEKDIALKEKVIDALGSELNAVANERDALRNEIACVKEVEFPRKAQAVADAWKGKCERLEAERDALRAKIERMTKRLHLILEEPEATMSNSKALREMVRQARLALEESK